MPTAALPATARDFLFLKPKSEDFWTSVGIFEEALREKADIPDLVDEVRRQLTLLGTANLRLLCYRCHVTRSAKAGAVEMVNALVAEAEQNTLIHVREFLRRRTEAIEEVYEQAFSDPQRESFETELINFAEEGRHEKLKPLTKLLLVYKEKPDFLHEAFYLQLWRSRTTFLEFEGDKPLPKTVADTLEAKQSRLLKLIKAALSNAEIRLLGIYEMIDGTTMVVLHREFTPTIKRDFRQDYNVHFGCGIVVFGVNSTRDRIVIKVGNSKLADTLKFFFEDEFKVKLKSLRGAVFSDYDPKSLEAAFLGGYKEDGGIQIAAAEFRRSGLLSRCPLSLTSYGATNSIRPDLKELAETKVIQLRSLDDLKSLTVIYDGKSGLIEVDVALGGAVTLKFNDAGWSDSQREKFEAQFLATFGVPVNRYIDPQKLEMGGIRVVASLLGMADEEDVQVYQQEKYHELLDAGLLVCEPKPARVCRSLVCRPKKPVLDETIQVCKKCDRPVEDSVIREVHRDNGGIAKFASSVLDAATSLSLGKPKTFEGLEYYPLRKKDHPESEEICIIIRDRLGVETKAKFLRSSMPLAIIESHTDDRFVFMDEEGIGRISLAYLYASQGVKDEKDACAKRCRELVKSLFVHHQDRISTAARLSYQHLIQGTAGDKGNVYETEVFNVLRMVLPYCYQVGREGKIEPDGFACLPVYEQDAMEGVESWNWTYDAKHSDKPTGYALGIDEHRKIVNYIEKFRGRVAFWDKSNKIRAHVIITNNLAESKMKNAAQFIYGDDGGVKKANRDVRLVLMRQEFVTRLYELVAEKKEDYQRRRPHFGKFLVSLLEREGKDGYTVLEKDDADKLIADLLMVRPVEKAITEGELIQGLE